MTVYSILSLGIKARSHRLHDLFCTRSCCSPGLTCTFSAFPSSSFFFNDPSNCPLSWACNSLWGPGLVPRHMHLQPLLAGRSVAQILKHLVMFDLHVYIASDLHTLRGVRFTYHTVRLAAIYKN